MGLGKIELRRWEKYFDERDKGTDVEKAALRARISASSAWRFERGDQSSSGVQAAATLGRDTVGGQLVLPPLSDEALRALEDFAYFRLRYFGRRATPWQTRAAHDALAALNDKTRKSYLVVNAPPGSGKSTLFTHDIPLWLICRDRRIRMMIGAGSERIAKMYVGRIKTSLEREAPLQADPDDLATAGVVDAVATLIDDFGAFKPEGRAQIWRAEALTVRQLDGSPLDDKEPTVTAWGRDSGFLGSRVHIAIWDDLVTEQTSKSLEAKDGLQHWLRTYAENRIEPGGAFILQGQRLAHDDLYRHALDKKRLDGTSKYAHVVYAAHDDEGCKGHDLDGQRRPVAWPDGCLLDPWRLPWEELETIRNDDPRTYQIAYQQQDGDGAQGLLEPVWITGGVDSFGYNSPGCLDKDRVCAQVPSHLTDERSWSFMSVDPSPTQWWGIIWWLYDPVSDTRYVLDIARVRMAPEGFLSLDLDNVSAGIAGYSGLLESWRLRANILRAPLQLVTFEFNGWQRYLMRQPAVQRWVDYTNVQIVGHTTHVNKADPKYGLRSIGDLFRQGKIRLPHGDADSRIKVDHLLREAKAWTGKDDEITDLLMSTWFAKLAVENHYTPQRWDPRGFDRPSFIGTDRGLASHRRYSAAASW